MLWMVRYRWPTGERFAFNCYRRWAKLLLRQPGYAPVILLSQEWVSQVDPLSIVLDVITLVPLAEDLVHAYPTILSPFYANGAAFDGSERQSVAQL